MNKGIALAGTITVDVIKHVSSYPPRHELSTITGMDQALGGLVSNCAIDLARMDPRIPITLIGKVGEDPYGRFVREEFARYPSIEASRIGLAEKTSFTDVVTEPDGGRTFFQFRGANALLDVGDFDLDALDADILHIGYILLLDALDARDDAYGTRMCRVLAMARARGILTSIDVVTEDSARYAELVTPALRYADLCVINELEAGRTVGIAMRDGHGVLLPEAMARGCRRLIEMGVSRWAVIHAPEGACGMEAGGAPMYRSSRRLPVGFIKSSVGAGDAFAAGILMALYRGRPLDEALDAAAIAAAWSLSDVGASGAMIAYDEMAARLDAMTGT